MNLDFSQCKTAEDVDKVFKKNKPQIDGYKELFKILTEKENGCKPSDLSELLARSLSILGDIFDPDECSYDHHGYCQAHGWFDSDIPCPHKRAKELLDEVAKVKAD